jgi:hypothetical protein
VNSHAFRSRWRHSRVAACQPGRSWLRARLARALKQGLPTSDDPRADMGTLCVPKVRAIRDGETLRVGPQLAITAHSRPGTRPVRRRGRGSRARGSRCLHIVRRQPERAVGPRFHALLDPRASRVCARASRPLALSRAASLSQCTRTSRIWQESSRGGPAR